MWEARLVGLSLILAASAPALAFHTGPADLVPIASFHQTGEGWYAVRLGTTPHPTEPLDGPEARIDVELDVGVYRQAVVVASLWNADTQAFLGAVITTYFVDEVGVVASSRTLGGTLIEPLTPSVPSSTLAPAYFVHSCCGPRHVLVSWSADGAIGDVDIAVTANELVTFEAGSSGQDSFLVRNDDFESLVHVGAGAGGGAEARAVLSGRATVASEAGEFFGFFLGITELGDDPLVCNLRIIGPDIDVETQVPDGDLACLLIVRHGTAGDYELRVERFVAPNVFTGEKAQVFAVGAFAALPAAP